MQKLQSSLPRSSGYAQAKAAYDERMAAMSPEERARYWEEYEERKRHSDHQDALEIQGKTLSSRIKHAGIPEQFTDAAPDRFGSSIVAYARALQHGGTESLIIRGDVGVGKTEAGCAILNRAVMTRPVRFITMARFKMLVNDVYIKRERSREDVFDEYANISVLMIDDLGKELTGANAANTILLLWELIDERSSNLRPTIVTTQYDSETLFKSLVCPDGDTATARAICDRLKTFASAHFTGKSKRKQGRQLDLGI